MVAQKLAHFVLYALISFVKHWHNKTTAVTTHFKNCSILQLLLKMFNLSALLLDDALLNALLQKSSCFQSCLLRLIFHKAV